MKNRGAIIGLLLVCMSLGTMMAQSSEKPSQEQREKRKAKMKEMKKAFIKTELDLTEEEEILTEFQPQNNLELETELSDLLTGSRYTSDYTKIYYVENWFLS